MIIIMTTIMITADTIIITVMGMGMAMFTITTMTTALLSLACSIAAPIRLVRRSPA
ncbi:hypothetical protein TM233_30870 [Bradyrhizobium sp. TM233]|nr:hypothetical protein TM233_30870 [Bradyrhizobium sp. TM233]